MSSSDEGASNSAIAGRVRTLRRLRQFTVRELAAMTGVSAGMISNIENDRTSPSIAVVASICHALEVEVADLFSTESLTDRATKKEDREVLHAADGIEKTVLLREPSRGVSFYEVDMPPGATTGTVNSHKGAIELVVVLSGAVSIFLDDVRISAQANESVKFRSEMNHYIANETTDSATFQWLITKRESS